MKYNINKIEYLRNKWNAMALLWATKSTFHFWNMAGR